MLENFNQSKVAELMATDETFRSAVAEHKKINSQVNKLDRKVNRGVLVNHEHRRKLAHKKRQLVIEIEQRVRSATAAHQAAA